MGSQCIEGIMNTHVHTQFIIAKLPPSMFWKVGGNLRSQRKPTQAWGEYAQTGTQAQDQTRDSVRQQCYPLRHCAAHSSNCDRDDTTVWAQMFVYKCTSNPTVKTEQGQMSDSLHLNKNFFFLNRTVKGGLPQTLRLSIK